MFWDLYLNYILGNTKNKRKRNEGNTKNKRNTDNTKKFRRKENMKNYPLLTYLSHKYFICENEQNRSDWFSMYILYLGKIERQIVLCVV